jgi:inorganic pyrophosphatase
LALEATDDSCGESPWEFFFLEHSGHGASSLNTEMTGARAGEPNSKPAMRDGAHRALTNAHKGRAMDLSKIPSGDEPPSEINAVIEIPQGSVAVKYEVDRVSGALFVDRFLHTPMFYPANFGFIPQTLCEDGDPCDVLVISHVPVSPLAVIRCRPIGGLVMDDKGVADEKIIAVPIDRLNPYYVNVRRLDDLPPVLLEQVAHFFTHYKDLEEGKWVNVSRWMEPDEAFEYVARAIARAQTQ